VGGGVRRAVAMALRAARRHGRVYTIGPLIHNHQAVEELRRSGVEVVEDVGDVPEGAVVVLRSHGVERGVREDLRRRGVRIVDATCPRVARIHGIIRSAAKRGHRVVIFGDPEHPEVVALRSEAEGVDVVTSPDDVERLQVDERPVCLVAQTTQNRLLYEEVVRRMRRRFNRLFAHQTICDSTRQRQDELREVIGDVDAVVVVGGHHSANTRRLAEIARTSGKPVHHIETAEQLPRDLGAERVFVTAGASTPNWVIQDVMKHLGGGGETRWRRTLFWIVRWNVTAAGGAAALSYTAASILNAHVGLLPLIAALYVWCVHTFNQVIALRLEPLTRVRGSDVLRLLLACVAGGLALYLGFLSSLERFFVVLVALVGGLLYGVEVIPTPGRLRSLRDLPGSKDIFCALGWAAVCALLPALSSSASVLLVVAAVAFVFLPVYIRSVLFDVRQLERDRFLGREAAPVVLGERSTVFVLALVAALWCGLVVVMVLSGAVGLVVLPLICLGLLFIVLLLVKRRIARFGGAYLEALTDAGLAALCLPFLAG